MRICIAVAVLASACMGSLTSGDDDSGGATGSGSGSGAPAQQPVKITVLDGGSPQAGIDVLFQADDATVLTETSTDANGVASAMLTSGSVTVARTFGVSGSGATRNPEIYTYVGVAAGDSLVLGDSSDDTTSDAPTAINVTVPDGAEGNVEVVSPCGTGTGTAPTVAVTVTGCPSSVMFYVTDDDDDAFAMSAPYSASIDLENGYLEGSLETTFTAQNITADMTAVTMEADAMVGTYELYSSGPQDVDAGPADVTLPDLTGIDELVVSTITSTSGTQLVATRKPYQEVPQSFDAIKYRLPYVSNATYAPNNVSWTESGNGSPDFVVVTLSVSASSNGAFTRYIIAPHSSTPTLGVPVLAGYDTTYNVSASTTFTGTIGLGSITGGYPIARQVAFTTHDLVDAAPMNATLALSYPTN